MDKIFDEIRKERLRQDQQWGGPDHDDNHDLIAWSDYIAKQNQKMRNLWNSRYSRSPTQQQEAVRDKLIKIAALAVAALQSLDRQAAAESDAKAQKLAQRFHELYEELAPQFGYETRKETAVAWHQVPERNRHLMIEVCRRIREEQELER